MTNKKAERSNHSALHLTNWKLLLPRDRNPRSRTARYSTKVEATAPNGLPRLLAQKAPLTDQMVARELGPACLTPRYEARD